MLGCDALDFEGDVVGGGFGGRVEDADAGLCGGQVKLPKREPVRDLVKHHLDVSDFGFAGRGGATW